MSNYENMWIMMDQYKFEIDNQILLHVKCIICCKCLIDAQQGPCGCNYCKKCIEQYLLNYNKYCPGNTDDCKLIELSFQKNITKDNGANRRVSKLRVICPSESCNHEDEMIGMYNHLKNCEEKTISCPYSDIGCNVGKMENEKIADHLLLEIHQHSKLMIEWMMNMKNEIASFVINKLQQGTQNQLEMLVEVLDNKIFQSASKIIEKQINDDRIMRKILHLKERIGNLENENEQLKKSRENSQSNNFLNNNSSINGDNLSNNSTFQSFQISSFVWKVGKIRNHCKTKSEIMSNYFHSTNNEYVMRLRLFPNGLGCSNISYLSIKLFFYDGGNKNPNNWPLKADINVTIKCNLSTIKSLTESKHCLINAPEPPNENCEIFNFNQSEMDSLRNQEIIIECNVSKQQ